MLLLVFVDVCLLGGMFSWILGKYAYIMHVCIHVYIVHERIYNVILCIVCDILHITDVIFLKYLLHVRLE